MFSLGNEQRDAQGNVVVLTWLPAEAYYLGVDWMGEKLKGM